MSKNSDDTATKVFYPDLVPAPELGDGWYKEKTFYSIRYYFRPRALTGRPSEKCGCGLVWKDRSGYWHALAHNKKHCFVPLRDAATFVEVVCALLKLPETEEK